MSTSEQSSPALSFDQRVEALEAKLPYSNMPGTSFTRVFKETQGVEWCLSLGGISMPKTFFRGPTLEDVLAQGERAVAEMAINGQNRLKTGWDTLDETLAVGEFSAGQ